MGEPRPCIAPARRRRSSTIEEDAFLVDLPVVDLVDAWPGLLPRPHAMRWQRRVSRSVCAAEAEAGGERAGEVGVELALLAGVAQRLLGAGAGDAGQVLEPRLLGLEVIEGLGGLGPLVARDVPHAGLAILRRWPA